MALLTKVTVDSIVADIEVKIESLETLADGETSAAFEKRRQAQDLIAQAEAGEAEAARALKIADNFTKLVS